jgi:hypothetical protein
MYRSVGLQVTANCTRNLDVGGTSASGYYTYYSVCLSTQREFGNFSDTNGTYSDAVGCPRGNSYIVEYAAAQGWMNKPLALTCDIQANEGTITSLNQEAASIFFDFVPGGWLTGEELRMFASAVVAAALQDAGVVGKAGPISSAVLDLLPADDTSATVDLGLVSYMMANGAAAAATAGYVSLLTVPVPSTYPPYQTLHTGSYSYSFSSYGWAAQWSKLAWGIISLLFGLSWLAAAIYMVKGGTAYDPTDWFQTMNTGAGSPFVPFRGTSTGAGLQGKHIDDTVLWYGEVGPSLIGFSNTPTVAVHPAKLYN